MDNDLKMKVLMYLHQFRYLKIGWLESLTAHSRRTDIKAVITQLEHEQFARPLGWSKLDPADHRFGFFYSPTRKTPDYGGLYPAEWDANLRLRTLTRDHPQRGDIVTSDGYIIPAHDALVARAVSDVVRTCGRDETEILSELYLRTTQGWFTTRPHPRAKRYLCRPVPDFVIQFEPCSLLLCEVQRSRISDGALTHYYNMSPKTEPVLWIAETPALAKNLYALHGRIQCNKGVWGVTYIDALPQVIAHIKTSGGLERTSTLSRRLGVGVG